MNGPEQRSYFQHPIVPDAAKKLDGIGETLAKIIALKQQQVVLFQQLWRIYLADCKRLGVIPRAPTQVR